MALYLVEAISIFRQRYVVDAAEASHAVDEVVVQTGDGYDEGLSLEGFHEFSQKHIDEVITSTREITPEEYIRIFDEDNDYLAGWNPIQKFALINKIEYPKNIGVDAALRPSTDQIKRVTLAHVHLKGQSHDAK